MLSPASSKKSMSKGSSIVHFSDSTRMRLNGFGLPPLIACSVQPEREWHHTIFVPSAEICPLKIPPAPAPPSAL